VIRERGERGRWRPSIHTGGVWRERRFVAQARSFCDSDSRDCEARARPQCSLPRPTTVRATWHRAPAKPIQHSKALRSARCLIVYRALLVRSVSTSWCAGMAIAAAGPAPIVAPVSGAASVGDSLLLAARSCVARGGDRGVLLRSLVPRVPQGCRGARASSKQSTKADYIGACACASQGRCIWPSATKRKVKL
jgi:hypothetical protein